MKDKDRELNPELVYKAIQECPDIEIVSDFMAKNTYFCKVGNKLILVKGKSLPLNSLSAPKIAKDKMLSKFAFRKSGVKTPAELVIDNEEYIELKVVSEKVEHFLKKYGTILAKPKNGSESHLIYPKITTVEQAMEAYQKISTFVLSSGKRYEGVLFEEYLTGNLYRLTFVGAKLVAAALRDYVRVTGDGNKTVSELFAPLRDYYSNHRIQSGKELPEEEDETAIKLLEEQGLSWDSIPSKGQTVQITEIPDPGFIVNVSIDQVSQTTKEDLEGFCRTIGLNYGGFDVIAQDISEPSYSVIEVNGLPDLDLHHYPDQGTSVDVAGAMVKETVKLLKQY